jgi:hypothetical protein
MHSFLLCHCRKFQAAGLALVKILSLFLMQPHFIHTAEIKTFLADVAAFLSEDCELTEGGGGNT